MPKIVKVGLNPEYVPAKDDKDALAAFAAAKAKGPVEMDYVTAMENVVNSGGLYALVTEDAPAAGPVVGILQPEDMSSDDLKLTAQRFGIDLTKKQMKRAELVKAIRLAMSKIEILDDDEDVPT